MSGPSRRTVLRGLGAMLALPWLESVPAHADVATPPTRLLFYTVPNGMMPGSWRPLNNGTGWLPSTLLGSLDRHRDVVSIPTGLGQPNFGAEPHLANSLAFLSGFATPPWQLPLSATFDTIDQRVAAAIGGATPLRSLELTSEGIPFCSEAINGLAPSCAPYGTVSWSDKVTPVPRLLSLRAVFDQLFGGTEPTAPLEALRRRRMARSVLDSVTEDASRLSARVSQADRATLDRYLTHIRELERQIDVPTSAVPGGDCGAGVDALAASGDLDTAADPVAHIATMRQLMVLALQCDRTRVISYMLGFERSDRAWPHLGVTSAHHQLSHHGGDAAKIAQIDTIGAWEVSTFAALLDDLRATPEGDGTLLDHTACLFGAPVGEPDSHDQRNLPLVVAGGGLPAAGHVAYSNQSIARLHLTLARHVGVDLPRFGEEGIDQPLPELTA